MPRLGAHVSTAGGVATAFARGAALDCASLQIFVKSPSQWRGRALDEKEIRAFDDARVDHREWPIVAHAAYLINLAAADPAVLDKSRRALADELERCERLGLDGLVVHPGAHLGAGEEAGLDAIARSLDEVLAARADAGPRLLLELTAGQGTVLGHRLEQLRSIVDRTNARDRLAFCLDTCHALAAGYPLDQPEEIEGFVEHAQEVLGDERILCWHLNDSVGGRGSRRDRHANIGEGAIGRESFRRLLAHPALASSPAILETPLGDDEGGHARDLATLRELSA